MDNQERRVVSITEDQLHELAEQSARKAALETVELVKTNLLKAIGESVLQKAVYVIGAGLLGGYWYLQSKGIIK